MTDAENGEPPRRQDAKLAEPTEEHDRIAREVVDAAFAVHSTLGPGLLESVYERCLVYELGTRGLAAQRQVELPVLYRGVRIDAGFRIDLLVQSLIVVEVKAVDAVLPVHQAQLLTYLKLSGHRLGILINFNVARIRDGLRRVVLST